MVLREDGVLSYSPFAVNVVVGSGLAYQVWEAGSCLALNGRKTVVSYKRWVKVGLNRRSKNDAEATLARDFELRRSDLARCIDPERVKFYGSSVATLPKRLWTSKDLEWAKTVEAVEQEACSLAEVVKKGDHTAHLSNCMASSIVVFAHLVRSEQIRDCHRVVLSGGQGVEGAGLRNKDVKWYSLDSVTRTVDLHNSKNTTH